MSQAFPQLQKMDRMMRISIVSPWVLFAMVAVLPQRNVGFHHVGLSGQTSACIRNFRCHTRCCQPKSIKMSTLDSAEQIQKKFEARRLAEEARRALLEAEEAEKLVSLRPRSFSQSTFSKLCHHDQKFQSIIFLSDQYLALM